jgi:pyridoxal phosphate enzyme (YggS family)
MKRKLIERLKRVRDNMAEAAVRSGRPPEQVKLVAVTKTVGVDVIRQLLEIGVTDIGENHVQELIKRAGMIQESQSRLQMSSPRAVPSPNWHMVGHLQRNKVKTLLPWVTMIHSLDSLRLAEEISNQAVKAGRTVDALIQVNASGEKSKFGVAVGAVTYLAEQICTLPGLNVIGLMTMAPFVDDPEATRPVFVRLREVFEEMAAEGKFGRRFRDLSMGMTQDYTVAIEEGATMVRIGTALFQDAEAISA